MTQEGTTLLPERSPLVGERELLTSDRDVPDLVTIVGGGISGALVAVQLARIAARPTRIEVIEPRASLGEGLAYSATDPAHRINVPAARMTVFADDPEHFERWLLRAGAMQDDAAARWQDGCLYPQRRLFGAYVAELVADALRANPHVTIRHRRDRVTRIDAVGTGFTLHLQHAEPVPLLADLVVLAVTHPPPAMPAPLLAARAAGAPIIADPWQAGALDKVAADADVLIIGTGLTMADVVATLERRGHRGRVTAISRRGLLSRGHAAGQVAKRDWFATAAPPRTALALCRAVRDQVRRAAAEGVPWQAVLDDARANGTRLWTALPQAEQRRLVRHLRPYWDVHRFRVAPQVEAAIGRMRADGRFTSLPASLLGADWDGTHCVVRLRPRGAPPGGEIVCRADGVVVTTGPAHGSALATNPALASLAAQGLLRPDPAGLGVDVDGASRVLGRDGTARANLLVAGPLARGRFGELMGLPQVAFHADDVARAAAAYLAARAPAAADAAAPKGAVGSAAAPRGAAGNAAAQHDAAAFPPRHSAVFPAQ
ncbi:MAG: FAD/NAD(P)-binding protein [Rhodospirillales bacterium]